MALTVDYSAEINSTVIGAGTVYGIVGISGLGRSGNRAAVLDRQSRPGVTYGAQYLASKTIVIDVLIKQTTAALLGSSLRSLIAAWRPSETGAETTLDLRIPGLAETAMRFYGVPEDAGDVSPIDAAVSKLTTVSLVFVATDPLMYGAAATTTTNAGNATSDRATVTITGTGGTPKIVNANDSNGTIEWNTTLAGAATRIVDLRAKTVVDGSGTDYRSEVLNTSTWYRHVSGTNSLTVTGCTASTSLRPAYY